VAADIQTKPTYLGRESACQLLSSAVAVVKDETPAVGAERCREDDNQCTAA